MSLLALDLASKTGWAVLPLDARLAPTKLETAAGVRPNRPLSGVQQIAAPGASIGRFADSYRKWLIDMIAVHAPGIVVFEAPWIGPQTHQDTARKLMGLAVLTELVAHETARRVFEANVAEVRKHFIGKGAGKRDEMKQMVMERCRSLGWEPRDDNEADALALADFALAMMNRRAA